MFAQVYLVHPVADKYTSSVLVAVKPRAVAFLKRLGAHHQIQKVGLKSREGANKRGNTSRLTQSFHFFMFEPIF
ncbi:hypothetical protein, partial [Escherichia coli]|uniref:hypothetical protein n=1 Tax=Escherichia coli TaxID=562 RepID=UPI001C6885AA